jgi:hypothetical protein
MKNIFSKNLLARLFSALSVEVGKEPVFLAGLGIVFLQSFQASIDGGLAIEDAGSAAVVFVLTVLARQLVYPAVKVDAATGALATPEQPLEPPFLGEDTTD